MDLKKIAKLDAALIKAAQGVRVLPSISWPLGSEETFLRNWRAGKKGSLPVSGVERLDLRDNIAALEKISAQCNEDDPVEKFLFETAQSYANAARMLGAVGTRDFTTWSVSLYGRPDMLYKLQNMTAVDAARFFLKLTDSLIGTGYIPPAESNISATNFTAWLKTRVDEFFGPNVVSVVEDADLSAKAAAGANRIRVRSSATFTTLDQAQLLNHEAFIHSATMLNGRHQINLQSLALGAPRTTRTQEGLAVLSELFTNSMDIARLRRIALRVIAVQKALDGADFIELFKFFLEAGQSEEDSVRSAQRIFRSGAVKDGIVFTKDAVYLSGLLEVHTFIRLAIRDSRPELIGHLFAGRLTLADVIRMAPVFKSGWLNTPRYVPDWASDLNRVAASMAYSAFLSKISLEKVKLNRLVLLEDKLKEMS